MTQFKKKSGNVTSIADEVAALHGLTKSTMRPLTKSIFEVLVKQLFERGKIQIPGFGSMTVEFSIKSGEPRAFAKFRWNKRVRDRWNTVFTDPNNLDFVNYILQRDETKDRIRDENRLKQLEYRARKKALRIGHERNRVAAVIKAATGIDADVSQIQEELLIPPHRIEVRDLIAATGVFPLEKLHRPAHLGGGIQLDPILVDRVLSE
jgi:nucleoid DNA-binding protein